MPPQLKQQKTVEQPNVESLNKYTAVLEMLDSTLPERIFGGSTF